MVSPVLCGHLGLSIDLPSAGLPLRVVQAHGVLVRSLGNASASFSPLFMDELLIRTVVTPNLEKCLGVVTLEPDTVPKAKHDALIRIVLQDRNGNEIHFVTLCSCHARELVAKLERACQEADELDDAARS